MRANLASADEDTHEEDTGLRVRDEERDNEDVAGDKTDTEGSTTRDNGRAAGTDKPEREQTDKGGTERDGPFRYGARSLKGRKDEEETGVWVDRSPGTREPDEADGIVDVDAGATSSASHS